MKKTIMLFLLIFASAFFFSVPVFAAEVKTNAEDIFPKEAGEMLLKNGFESLEIDTLTSLNVNDALKYIFNCVKNEITAPFLLIYAIFLIILITVIASGMNGGFLNTELQNNFSVIGVLCICATTLAPIITCLQETMSFIKQMSSFIQVFTPALTGVMVIGGQSTAGLGYQSVMLAASEILSSFLSGIIMPLLFIYLAFTIAGRATAWFNLESVTASVKSTVTWCLTLTMSLFVSLITIKGLIGAGADSLALRTGKFFVGSFVPAVGGALSEAAATVQKSVVLIKNTTGIFGIIAAAMYFIPPLIKVLLYKFTCDISSMIGDVLGAKQIAGLIRDISTVLGLVSAVILSYGALVILSTAVTLMLGNGG